LAFGGYGLALAALALVVFGAYDSYPIFLIGVTIYTLHHLKCIRLVSVRSNHLPFKMRLVGFRALKSSLY